MTPAEAATVLTYINQVDPLVPINDVTSDIWWESIRRYETEQAVWCIKDYYANTKPGWDGRIPPLTPAVLRARIVSEQERATAKRRALEPPTKRSPRQTWRDRNPGAWDKLHAEGQDAHREDLQRRGIPLLPHQQPRGPETPVVPMNVIPKPAQADPSASNLAA